MASPKSGKSQPRLRPRESKSVYVVVIQAMRAPPSCQECSRSMLLVRAVQERAPEQDGKHSNENDRVLERTRKERGIRLKQPNDHGSCERAWETCQTGKDGRHKSFEADQESGVIKDRHGWCDEHPRQCAKRRRKRKADLSCPVGRQPPQFLRPAD